MTRSLTKTGVVKGIRGRRAIVVTRMEPECEGCAARAACSATGGGGANVEVLALNTIGAEAGDIVTISIRGSSIVKVSFLVYMIPILALLAGAILGVWLSGLADVDENVAAGILGLLALCGSFVWVKKKGEELSQKKEFIPEIVSTRKAGNGAREKDVACPVKN